MPELPEVETIKSGIEANLIGHRITDLHLRRQKLRYVIPYHLRENLINQTILNIRRRSKYLLIDLCSNNTVLIHFGMSGRVLIYSDLYRQIMEKEKIASTCSNLLEKFDICSVFNKHDHIIFLTDQKTILIYHDVRRFGFIDLIRTDQIENSKWLKKLGVEPLDNAFNADYLAQKLRNKTCSIKSALLDQRIIAGIGNIYASEALFNARIFPFQPACSLGSNEIKTLVKSIKYILQIAIKKGGSSLKDYVLTDGSLGFFQHDFQAYNRKGKACHTKACTANIIKQISNGRATYFCPICQKNKV